MRNHVSLALAARNDAAHAGGTIADVEAVSYLRSIQAVAEALDSKSAAGFKALIDDQTKAMAAALGVTTEVAANAAATPSQARSSWIGGTRGNPGAMWCRRTPT